MDNIELGIPAGIVDSLPPDSEDTKRDMEQAVGGWERELNAALNTEEPASAVVDHIEQFESRWEAYDEYVVELRAWGQSPIYAMAWRDLHAAVIARFTTTPIWMSASTASATPASSTTVSGRGRPTRPAE